MKSGKVIELVPPAGESDQKGSLMRKLDRLAEQIADDLIGGCDVADRIAGLMALTAFWQSRNGKGPATPPENAFDRYRKAQGNAEED